MALQYSEYGQVLVFSQLEETQILVASVKVRFIWQRYSLDTVKKSLKIHNEKMVKKGVVNTDDQIHALET